MPSSRPIPTRRRVWLACTTCRARKTRCNAAKPKCSLCAALDVECVYQDSQQPRIDPTAKLLLDRIQALEDRLFASPALSASRERHADTLLPSGRDGRTTRGGSPPLGPQEQEPETDRDIPFPYHHTAGANHLLNWPVIREIFSRAGQNRIHTSIQPHSATDVFFEAPTDPAASTYPHESWRLFDTAVHSNVNVENFISLIHSYFGEVNLVYPILSRSEILRVFENVVASEQSPGPGCPGEPEPVAHYCLLLLVLCVGAFIRRGGNQVRLTDGQAVDDGDKCMESWDGSLWKKASLLLGYISSTVALEAAQCSMIASIYMGALGRVADSYHWAHATSVKCAHLVKRASSLSPSNHADPFPEPLRRLYWVAFIYEGDYGSEISINLPSGMAMYEDIVPYPGQYASLRDTTANTLPSTPSTASSLSTRDPNDEFVAFQLTTNAAIRRFLNRVHSLVYNHQDHSHRAPWLLHMTDEFSAYHDAIYKHVPDFLLSSQRGQHDHQKLSPPNTGTTCSPSMGMGMDNDSWNVLRLRGRYYACQHIIHRPLVEYVLGNSASFHADPDRDVILGKCRLCLLGCIGFIEVFDVEDVNSVTCLFATGLAYIIILRVATICPHFTSIIPDNIEEVIATGMRNLRRFSVSIKEFRWHLGFLEEMHQSCGH
ncbi:hypothetical protein BJX68DRAFT_261835 [Aspergillus pseudodeflectus]|uniref:Zn(2)-C6 fungal-type domain-containing protein n=1 Tax=Aspergillus pseudodeflectus TaxID=176178 RepID=A0ABR4L5G7_9EURO